ncbi:MAG: lauroyl acyltransferase [Lysobacter sp.]|nr:lauroyl acyltransferase [Lysobacter sp.]
MVNAFARLLYLLAAGVGLLPWSWLRRAADGIAASWRAFDVRESRVVRRNLELAFPVLPFEQRDQLHRRVLSTTTRQALETLRLWTRPHAENLALIRETHGLELFDTAIAAGRGVIVAAPHYGNWELLNQWLAARTPIAILYSPPQSAIGEAFLRIARADEAQRVQQIRADGPAVRQLWKVLKGGGVVGILPDQQPKLGDGEFAPFFGVHALTMTLLNRLAERTGATVLFAYCERIDDRQEFASPAFALRFETAPAQLASTDPVAGVTALNAAIQRIVSRDPAQYQWTYKRYSIPPPDGSRGNPYWPDCYPRRYRRLAVRNANVMPAD